MPVDIQTRPKAESDGTVLIVVDSGMIQEVISDLQLDVQVAEASSDTGGYTGFKSRPLWEYVRKTTNLLLRQD